MHLFGIIGGKLANVPYDGFEANGTSAGDGDMLQPSQLNLWAAADTSDVAALQRALDLGASVACSNRAGWNALHLACRCGSEEVLLPTLHLTLTLTRTSPAGVDRRRCWRWSSQRASAKARLR